MSNITGMNAILIASARVYAGLLDRNTAAIQGSLQAVWSLLYVTEGQIDGVKDS